MDDSNWVTGEIGVDVTFLLGHNLNAYRAREGMARNNTASVTVGTGKEG